MKTTLLFLSVFFSLNLFGQIAYTDLEPDISLNTSSQEYFIDFNEDGIQELSLFVVENEIQFLGATTTTGINLEGESEVIGYANPNIYMLFVENLPMGHILNQQDVFIGDSSNYFLPYPIIKNSIEDIDSDEFQEGANGYIGVKFYISGVTHFGWIQIESMNEGETLIIKDYAYQISPESSILIGDTGTSTNDLIELTTSKNLIQILDMMGCETYFKPNTPLIYVYDDGSTEKVFSVEY